MINVFAKYMKESGPHDHSELSASGSSRWLSCPGSVKLSEGMPTSDSAASIRGTQTHTLLQFILENKDWEFLLSTSSAREFKKWIEFDGAMLSNALFSAKWIWLEKAKMFSHYKKWPRLLTEIKLELKDVGFGTSDVILYHPYGTLHVIDYKNGTKTVDPENNTQGLYYAVAAADLFNWEFSDIAITIIQPNAAHSRGQIRTWKTSEATLREAELRFREGALATKKLDAPLVKDEGHCWFCPARPKCPLHEESRENKVRKLFNLKEEIHAKKIRKKETKKGNAAFL